MIDAELVRGVRLLSLDAGNTVIFLDHARLARLAGESGFTVSPEALIRAEGEAKRLHEKNALLDIAWSESAVPGARGWAATTATILHRAGMPHEALSAALDAIWKSHVELNLWSLVPDGFGAAMDRLHAAGAKIAIVSNSEGMLDTLFKRLGILHHFDVLIDSGKLGIEKPDPRIFDLALMEAGIDREHALHLGDTFTTDIVGARAANMRVALIDPYGHYEGAHLDVPRVPGVVAVADAILAAWYRAALTPEGV